MHCSTALYCCRFTQFDLRQVAECSTHLARQASKRPSWREVQSRLPSLYTPTLPTTPVESTTTPVEVSRAAMPCASLDGVSMEATSIGRSPTRGTLTGKPALALCVTCPTLCICLSISVYSVCHSFSRNFYLGTCLTLSLYFSATLSQDQDLSSCSFSDSHSISVSCSETRSDSESILDCLLRVF